MHSSGARSTSSESTGSWSREGRAAHGVPSAPHVEGASSFERHLDAPFVGRRDGSRACARLSTTPCPRAAAVSSPSSGPRESASRGCRAGSRNAGRQRLPSYPGAACPTARASPTGRSSRSSARPGAEAELGGIACRPTRRKTSSGRSAKALELRARDGRSRSSSRTSTGPSRRCSTCSTTSLTGPGCALLLLCLARPELLDARPRGAAASRGHARAALPGRGGGADRRRPRGRRLDVARARIREVAEGNPLFVEQLLALLAEGGDRGRRAPDHPGAPRRAARRAAGGSAILERASVVGLDSSGRRSGSSRRTRRPTGRAAGALVRKELIRRPPRSADTFRFRHLLIRDAAYARLRRSGAGAPRAIRSGSSGRGHVRRDRRLPPRAGVPLGRGAGPAGARGSGLAARAAESLSVPAGGRRPRRRPGGGEPDGAGARAPLLRTLRGGYADPRAGSRPARRGRLERAEAVLADAIEGGGRPGRQSSRDAASHSRASLPRETAARQSSSRRSTPHACLREARRRGRPRPGARARREAELLGRRARRGNRGPRPGRWPRPERRRSLPRGRMPAGAVVRGDRVRPDPGVGRACVPRVRAHAARREPQVRHGAAERAGAAGGDGGKVGVGQARGDRAGHETLPRASSRSSFSSTSSWRPPMSSSSQGDPAAARAKCARRVPSNSRR